MQNHTGLIPPDYGLDLVTLLALAFKFAVFGMLLLLALVLVARRRDDRGRSAALFTLGIANYVVCTILHEHAFFWPAILVYVGCAAVPFLLWLFTRALFDDEFRLKLTHLAAGVAFVVLQLGVGQIERSARGTEVGAGLLLVSLVPKIATIGLIFAALVHVIRGWSADLVESRRQFRMVFTSIAGAYALLVTIIEIALRGSPAPAIVELLHAAGLSITTLFFGERLLLVRADLFAPDALGHSAPLPGFVGAGPANPVSDTPAGAASPGSAVRRISEAPDAVLLERLSALMAARVWTEEGLTIRVLAAKLFVPEYKVRQAINGALGFRNFNDYLNRYRVAEACLVLADPARADVPVLRLAMDLGYGSLAPFNRAFRQLTGRTPTDFRRVPGEVPGLAVPPFQPTSGTEGKS